MGLPPKWRAGGPRQSFGRVWGCPPSAALWVAPAMGLPPKCCGGGGVPAGPLPWGCPPSDTELGVSKVHQLSAAPQGSAWGSQGSSRRGAAPQVRPFGGVLRVPPQGGPGGSGSSVGRRWVPKKETFGGSGGGRVGLPPKSPSGRGLPHKWRRGEGGGAVGGGCPTSSRGCPLSAGGVPLPPPAAAPEVGAGVGGGRDTTRGWMDLWGAP